MHELVSPVVHVDVHIVAPTTERNTYTLVTSGMSDRPMNSPLPEARFAELMITLPPEWKIDEDSVYDENNYWPIRQLKFLARFPHEFNTWIWGMHTIPNGDPPSPYADSTDFCCMLLGYPFSLPKDFYELKIDENKTIHFFPLIPIYADEMEYKLQKGAETLFERLDKCSVAEVIDVSRASCIKKSWLGRFFG